MVLLETLEWVESNPAAGMELLKVGEWRAWSAKSASNSRPDEIKAVAGHTTSRMVEHYTKTLDRKKRAGAAILKLERLEENGE